MLHSLFELELFFLPQNNDGKLVLKLRGKVQVAPPKSRITPTSFKVTLGSSKVASGSSKVTSDSSKVTLGNSKVAPSPGSSKVTPEGNSSLFPNFPSLNLNFTIEW